MIFNKVKINIMKDIIILDFYFILFLSSNTFLYTNIITRNLYTVWKYLLKYFSKETSQQFYWIAWKTIALKILPKNVAYKNR